MTLTEFLLARIAEDEASARRASVPPERVIPPDDAVTWTNLPERDTPAHWGWSGGPSRAADVDPRLVDAFALTDADSPYRVSPGGTWDESEPTGARYDVAVIPADHDAADHIARHDPARVLADCEAERRIVDLHRHAASNVEVMGTFVGGEPFVDAYKESKCATCGTVQRGQSACPTLRALALPYRDHPDYREEWRP